VTTTGIMQQFGTSAFYTVLHWHKLGEVDNEYVSHNFIVLVIRVRKIIKFGRDLTKLLQKQVGSFFGPPCRSHYEYHTTKCGAVKQLWNMNTLKQFGTMSWNMVLHI